MSTKNNQLSVKVTDSKQKEVVLYARGAVLNPRTPFSDDVSLGWGDMIIVRGSTPQKVKGFTINLVCGGKEGKKDIALHINARFDKKEIVRNSNINKQWGPEDKTTNLANLKAGQHFECIIFVHSQCYKIAFNSKHLADFKHRLPYDTVTTLDITGELAIESSYIQRRMSSKSSEGNRVGRIMPVLQSENIFKEMPSSPKDKRMPTPVHLEPDGYHLDVPYISLISDGMAAGRTIYISAVPILYPRTFSVNLKIGHQNNSDVALHLSVRFDQRAIVCNTMTNGKWGKEKRMESYFPFKVGVHFDLMIHCESDAFLVSVNNQHLVQYYHRFQDLKSINTLNINDVSLLHVRVQ